MPRYNDISLLYTPIASSGGGGVSSISLNNGITSIAGDTAFINAKGSGTLDVVASVVRGSNTILGTLDVSGTSIFKSPATFKAITGDSIYTTGSASFGPLTAGLSRLGTVISGGLTSTSISSTGGVSAGSLVIGGTSSLQGGLTVVGTSNLGAVNATTLSGGSINISGSTTVSGISAYSLNVSNNSTLAGVSSTTLSSGTLAITGQSSLAGVSTTNLSATTLGVSGQSSLAGVSTTNLSATTLVVSGQTNVSALSASSITVSGSSTYAGINCYSLNISTATTTSSLNVLNAITTSSLDVGSSLTVSKIFEKTNIVDATSLLLDMNLGSSFILPLSFLPTANYSISIVNVPLDTNKVFTITLITRQATTSFYASTLKVSNVSNQFILGSSSTVGSAIFNGGPPTFSTSPCLITQCFNIISIPDNSSLGTYSRFITSSVNCHY